MVYANNTLGGTVLIVLQVVAAGIARIFVSALPPHRQRLYFCFRIEGKYD